MQISADTTSNLGCVAMVLVNRTMKIEAGGDCMTYGLLLWPGAYPQSMLTKFLIFVASS